MMDETNYTHINSKAIDQWVVDGWEWGIPITHDDYVKAKNGEWNVLLTPTKCIPKNWFPKLNNKKLLGLASAGGQQMPVFAALGAECTVLDYSDKQLESEKIVAEREGYEISIVKSDMTKILPFKDNTFDVIFHPVSNIFIENVYHVWNECYRILKKGGVLLSGLDNGINFLFDDDEKSNEIEYEKIILKSVFGLWKDRNITKEVTVHGLFVGYYDAILENDDYSATDNGGLKP